MATAQTPSSAAAAAANSPTLLILAGKRDGKLDPLAEKAGVSHKCRVPIQGKPLLQWVLEAAGEAWPDNLIIISIHDPEVIADLPAVVALKKAGRLTICEAQAGIVESVEAAVAESGNRFPLLITTGDNVLATPESLREIHDHGIATGSGAVLAVARREDILAAHPEGQRKFYEFRDVAIANCNAYWLGNAHAMRAAEAFRQGGQFIKTRGRIAQAFGILNLIRFKLGWWSLDQIMGTLSRRFGVKITAHVYDDGAYAVDVDNQRTYDVCEELLAKRKL
ncbi:nucleotidyltransferase family protein [Alterisphingorhabdus coralli]|uniref:Nucleotidyltransferase family protein n=1 Tax=Alterisphingorhabdus coralli TaxID=3071408 RepID=A0AA97F7E5_9SPHN|nr:nucleotidyltransferase family protein [Parasphingorhabdus sp. SCSIO 66989]WOE74856.1 nucleotidyltransferase family protein [Parasphingorhabdus sp. SCSIO 66989]